MITKKCLRARINGADYVCHLHTSTVSNAFVAGYIRVRVGGSDLYCPISIIVRTGTIHVIKNGGERSTLDLTPVATIEYTYSYDSRPYEYPYLYKSMAIAMRNDVTINTVVELQNQNQNGSWYTALQIAKGGTSATAPTNYRRYSPYWRVKVGSWATGTYTLTSSSGSVDISIPEAYWGV